MDLHMFGPWGNQMFRKSQWADGNLEFEVVDSGSIATAPDSYLVIAARDLGSKNITAFANVEVGEILIFDSALSNSEVYAIQGYLAHKWGLTDYAQLPPLQVNTTLL